MKVDEFCGELVVAASDFIDAALDDHEGPTVSKEFSQSRQKLVSLITQWVRGDVARTLNTTTTDRDEEERHPNMNFDEILRTIVVIDPLTLDPEQIGPEIQKWIALGYDVEIPNLPTNRPEYALQWSAITK